MLDPKKPIAILILIGCADLAGRHGKVVPTTDFAGVFLKSTFRAVKVNRIAVDIVGNVCLVSEFVRS